MEAIPLNYHNALAHSMSHENNVNPISNAILFRFAINEIKMYEFEAMLQRNNSVMEN